MLSLHLPGKDGRIGRIRLHPMQEISLRKIPYCSPRERLASSGLLPPCHPTGDGQWPVRAISPARSWDVLSCSCSRKASSRVWEVSNLVGTPRPLGDPQVKTSIDREML